MLPEIREGDGYANGLLELETLSETRIFTHTHKKKKKNTINRKEGNDQESIRSYKQRSY